MHFQFLTDPISVSSFSIFCWIYHPNTWYDGVFAYSSTQSIKEAEISFFNGWSGEAAKAQIHLKPALENARYTNNVKWSLYKWIYIGVVFSAQNGNFREFVMP